MYVVDAGIAIDNINGYNFSTDSAYTKPYSEYAGKQKVFLFKEETRIPISIIQIWEYLWLLLFKDTGSKIVSASQNLFVLLSQKGR